MSEQPPRRAPSPWRWVLLVVVIVAAGYSLYYAGGITSDVNETPLPATPPARDEASLPVCPLADGVELPERVDVRFRIDTTGPNIVATRLTGQRVDGGLRVRGLRGSGTGTVRLSDGGYAEFHYTEEACSPVTRLPDPTDEPVAEETP